MSQRASSPAQRSSRAGTSGRGDSCIPVAVLVFVLVGALVAWLLVVVDRREPLPLTVADGCVARVGGNEAVFDLEQSQNAAIIASVAVKRGLAPRAVSIALATAMQESGLRNLDYGDRDSIGLFQQRPSKGWGSQEQIMDPYYSAGKFYDALVKIRNWRTGDINDVAQAVQRSGVPDGYRRHVNEARTLASVLSGETPAGLSCVREDGARDVAALATSIRRSYGSLVSVRTTAAEVVLQARNSRTLWSATHFALAQSGRFSVRRVQGPGRQWELTPHAYASWTPGSGAKGTASVLLE